MGVMEIKRKKKTGNDLARIIRNLKRVSVCICMGQGSHGLWVKAQKADLADCLVMEYGVKIAPFVLRYEGSFIYLCRDSQLTHLSEFTQ